MRRARVCRRLAARSMPLIRSMCSKAPAAISMVCRAATIICCRRGSCLALKPMYHFLTPSVAWQHSRRRQPARRTMPNRWKCSGTLRGRVGYAPNLATGTGNWFFYATGGFAWSYDQFTRTQIFGVPAGGTAIPGTVENAYYGAARWWRGRRRCRGRPDAKWAARIEYLYTDYASRGVTFPAGAQTFSSALALQSVRVGVDYQLGHDGIDPDFFTKGPDALDPRPVRGARPNDVHRAIRPAVSFTLSRPP